MHGRAQVVGWPPIRSYRKKSFEAIKEVDQKGGLYVKVSMDGAPYLRKIDLNVYQGYEELRLALEDMFKCFSIGIYIYTSFLKKYEIYTYMCVFII